MATTNFKRFDEALENILTDLEYLNNSTRYNGAQSGIYPASLHNKFAYQASAMASGLADMMVAKGYTVEDGSLGTTGHDHAALVAVLGNLITQYDLDALELVYPDPSLPDQTLLTATRSVSDIEADKLGEPFAMTFPRGTYVFKDTYTGLATTTMYLMAGAVIQPWYSVRSSAYIWTLLSGSEYRCDLADGSDPDINTPLTVYANGVPLTAGTLGSLNAGEYAFASGRLVVRLADSADPDTKADGYITVGYAVTFNNCCLPFLAQCFDLSGGGQVLPRNCGDFAPEWWGAKPDETTPCTTAFTNAVAAMPSENPSAITGGTVNGGVLQLGTGTYLLDAAWTIPIPGVKVRGMGGDSTVLNVSSAVGSGYAITLASAFDSAGYPGWKKEVGFHLSDFCIITNHNDTSGIIIKQAYLNRGVVERLNICGYGGASNTGTGITDDGETNPAFSNGFTIQNCDVIGFKYGIKNTERAGNTVIRHNFLEGNAALSGSTAIYLEGVGTKVEFNYMQSWDYGFKNLKGYWSFLLGNTFELATITTKFYYEDNSGDVPRQAFLLSNAWNDETKITYDPASTQRIDHLANALSGSYPTSGQTDLHGYLSRLALFNPQDTNYTYYPPHTAADWWELAMNQFYGLVSGTVYNTWGTAVVTYEYWSEISSHSNRLDIGTVDHPAFPIVLHAGPNEVARGQNGHWFISAGTPPADATANGEAGELSWDATHLYLCIAHNSWVRCTLAAW